MRQDSIELGERSTEAGDSVKTGPIALVSRLVSGGEQDPDRRVTAAEATALFLSVAVGLVALVSLAAAHLHHHSPTVVWPISLVLIAVAAFAVWRWDRPAVRLDRTGLIPVIVGAGIACILMFPGFSYATGDRDPGGYVEHAVAIQRTGSVDFSNDLLANNLPAELDPIGGSVWPALWVEKGNPTKVFPQFYHLWPALLATAKDVGGFTGLFNTGPLLGVLCVVFATCIGRRLAGWPGAWTAAALLSTNMLEVWQAKYPSAEIFGQFLFLAATLGVVIAIQSGWRTAAAIGGVMIGLTYLERPDGIVLVLISWAALAAVLAARRFDARATSFAAGLVILLPYGFLQAYHLARRYTLINGVPTLPKVLALMLILVVIAAIIARQRRAVDWVMARSAQPRLRFGLSAAFVVVCAALMILGMFRPRLFGADYFDIGGTPVRSYDEASLIRLSWFFSLSGLALVGAGIAYIALRKWRFDAWVVALPAAALLTLYCYHVRNSPYMMWATRRFVPTVVPGMVLLIGCGVALVVVLVRRWLPNFVAVLTAAAILLGLSVFYLSESWPLHRHDENGKSIEVVQQIASVAGDQKGIFLWQAANYCCAFPSQLFGGPLFAIADESSAALPAASSAVPDVVNQYLAFAKSSGRPLFYIADRATPPPAVPGMTATKVNELIGSLPHWEETFTSRPSKTANYPYDMTIYRLTNSAG